MPRNHQLFVCWDYPDWDLTARRGDLRAALLVSRFIKVDSQPGARPANPLADFSRVLTNARCEHEPIDTSQHSGECSDLLGHAINKVIDGKTRLRLCAANQVAHVVADA